MKCFTISLLLGVGVFFSACGNAEWSRAEQNNLLKRCKDEGGTKSYCKCYLSNAMKAYPNAEEVEELDFEGAVELSINCE